MSRRLSMSVAHKSTSGSFLEIPQVVDPVGNPSLLIANTVAALRLATLPAFAQYRFASLADRGFAGVNVATDFAPATRGQKLGERRAKPLAPSGNGLHIARAIGENFG
jgi:hypothetical protein